MQQETEPDRFTKWMLGVAASAIVAVGGWLAASISDLNEELVRNTTEMAAVKHQLAGFNYELEQNTVKLNILNDRVTRLEVLIEQDRETLKQSIRSAR